MSVTNVSIEATNVLRILSMIFPKHFKKESLVREGLWSKVEPFWSFFLDEHFVDCINEEMSLYRVTNRSMYVLSLENFTNIGSVSLTEEQKKTLIIIKLLGGTISVPNTIFIPSKFCDFEALIQGKFINSTMLVYELSEKGNRFVRDYCKNNTL